MCFFSGSFVLNYVKILFLLKLYNLHLIDVTLQRVLQFHRTRSTAYLVSRLIMIMVMLCHYIGGIFYAIDLYVYNNNYYGPNTPAWCWLYSASAYSQMVIELPWILQYEYTMYWSLATMTTIAYGDITPLNPMETVGNQINLVLRYFCPRHLVHYICVYPEWNHRNPSLIESFLIKLSQIVRNHESIHDGKTD